MTGAKRIDTATMQQMTEAAQAMGVGDGRQNFRTAGIIPFHVVDAFSTYFGEWAHQDPHVLVHLFPRAGAPDTWYEARYVENGRRYIPGRREFKPEGLFFPANIEDLIKDAAGAVTFGDVELDNIEELGAWAVRFKDVAPKEDWLKEGGLLEQFFIKLDEAIEARSA